MCPKQEKSNNGRRALFNFNGTAIFASPLVPAGLPVQILEFSHVRLSIFYGEI